MSEYYEHEDQIKAMLAGRRKVRALPFPDLKDVEFGVRILTEEELDDSRLEAQKYVEGRAATLGLELARMLLVDPELLDREIKRQIIFHATVNPSVSDNPPPFFPEPGEIRKLDSVIVETLYQCYEDHQNFVDPLINLDEE
ncbi:unnamed protein product, partial [marine sediment metagenome]